MKKYHLTLLLASLWHTQLSALPLKDNAGQLLAKTAASLSALQKVKYRYTREISYVADNYYSKDSANCYFEFDKNITARFQLDADHFLQIYNGTEYFSLDRQAKIYELNITPAQKSFSNLSYLFNSIPALRNGLPEIIGNNSVGKTATDTLIANKSYQILQLTMHNKVIGYLGGFQHVTTKMDFYYSLIIDPLTSLPVQVIERNSLNRSDRTVTIFKDVQTRPDFPGEQSWYYTTYTGEYKPAERAILKPLIAVGTLLKDWELPEYKKGNPVILQSRSLKGKIVIMEFWIKNCGPCMDSFPRLKRLHDKYKKSAVQLVTINAYDAEKDVGFFYNRERPGYKMLFSGRALADLLGINMFPQAIVVDQSGYVIYAGAFGDSSAALINKTIDSHFTK